MDSTDPLNRAPRLGKEILLRLAELLKGELSLARLELGEKAGDIKIGLVCLGIAGVLSLPAFFILFMAAVYGLQEAGVSPALSALAVGAVALAVVGILSMIGLSRLSAERLTPHRTFRQIRHDQALVREMLK